MEQALLPLPAQADEGVQAQLSHQKSVALVEIFLNATIACICYSRELLDWQSPCFKKRCVDDIRLNCSANEVYNDFINLDRRIQTNSQEIRVLVRSQNHHANRIMDMLECGVFQALQAGHLDTLKVFITDGGQHEKRILEYYTYCFRYHDAHVAGVELQSSNGTLTVEDSLKSFKKGIRGLLRSMKLLSKLPDRCAFGMSIAYTSQCPSEYEPVCFTTASSQSVYPKLWHHMWVEGEDWHVQFDTTSCSLLVKAETFRQVQSEAASVQDAQLGNQLQAMQQTSSNENNAGTSTLPLPTQYPTKQPYNDTWEADSSQESEYELLMDPDSYWVRGDGTLPWGEFQEMEIAQRPRVRQIVMPAKLAELIIHAYAINATHPARGLIFDEAKLESGIIRRIVKSTTIRCDCGSNNTHNHPELLYCALCDTSQHQVCYGLHQILDRPYQHFCYSCLLGIHERHLLVNLQRIAYVRRAIRAINIMCEAEFEIDDEFAMDCFGPCSDRMEKTKILLDILYEEHVFLQLRNGNAMHNDDLHVHDREDFTERFLEPFIGVEHFYRPVSGPGSIRRRKAKLQEAMETLSEGRDYKKGDVDEVEVLDTYDTPVMKYGYFPNLRPRISTQNHHLPPQRRKLSVSRNMVNSYRSSPDTANLLEQGVADILSALDRDSNYGSQDLTAVTVARGPNA